MKTHYNTIRFLWLALLLFWGQEGFSQDFQYQWAKSGGGSQGVSGTGFDTGDETIYDIKTDADNNYYFLAPLRQHSPQFDGIEVPYYGNTDIFIFSTDCNGVFRWSQTIGGSHLSDQAYTIALDDNGGLYVVVSVLNTASETIGNNNIPVHFSPDDVMPVLPAYNSNDPDPYHEGKKTGFLIKYSTENGDLIWRKPLQGDVNSSTRASGGFVVAVDTDNIIHTILAFKEGVHLDGMVTVTEEGFKYFLVKFDTEGTIVGTPQLLPIDEGVVSGNFYKVKYDEALNRYYIGGPYRFVSTLAPLSYGGVPFEEDMSFVFCFDGTTLAEVWRKQLSNLDQNGSDHQITDIYIGENSDVYISGKYFNPLGSNNTNTGVLGDYVFPQSIGGHIPFALKMNSNGAVQWATIPDAYPNPIDYTARRGNPGITVNANEVASLPAARSLAWGDFSVDYPAPGSVPLILRLDKETGEPIGLHDVMEGSANCTFSVITADQDGNYVAGGYFWGTLFSDHPDVPTLYNQYDKTDFFIAKLGATACGVPVFSDEAFELQNIKLYPNPTQGYLYWESNKLFKTYEVYSSTGQKVLAGNISKQELSLESLPKGLYLIKFRDYQNKWSTHKVIKE